MQPTGLFDMFDQLIAEGLEVDIQTYIDTIDKFNDEDMEYIIHTIMDTSKNQDDKDKAKQLFKSKIAP